MQVKQIIILFGLFLINVNCNSTSKEEAQNIEKDEVTPSSFQNKGHELVYNMVEKVGNYQKLLSKKDVVYTYTYTTPDHKVDISTEKYIFDGELSYGEYKLHQRTLPEYKGIMEQGFDGSEYWIKINGIEIHDSSAIKKVKFTRPTNFYWFTMFQKLLDPGLRYEYLGQKKINSNDFDVIKITFDSDKPTDIYQLYINKETGLVTQFLFTVVDHGVIENPMLMQLEYEQIDNILIPTKRKYKKSNWNADELDGPWVTVNWTDIKFNNNLKKEDFSK